ncbi:MAG: hypothetical protein HY962_06155 [Ignavibacteriae bacterium]|nr:hypothetical protein [Ignavibacteriota bacterium]
MSKVYNTAKHDDRTASLIRSIATLFPTRQNKMFRRFLMLSALSLVVCCTAHAQAGADTLFTDPALASLPQGSIVVRYYHPTLRCVTCLSIEEVTRNLVREAYSGDSTIVFQTVNIDEAVERDFIERYKLSSSALFLCTCAGCLNLTKEAFEYALGDIGRLPQMLIRGIEEARARQCR